MTCEVAELMEKHEQYVRGWIRLYGQENSTTVTHMGKYAVDLCKLKRKHLEECPWCRQREKQAVQ